MLETTYKIKDDFLKAYDHYADDIFAYCYDRIAHRDVAAYVTGNIFMKTWDLLSTGTSRVLNIKKTLYRVARNHTRGFGIRRHVPITSEGLWNLTLSQQ